MKPPTIAKIGSKRSSWMNFMEICGLYVSPTLSVVSNTRTLSLFTNSYPPLFGMYSYAPFLVTRTLRFK